MPLTEVKEVNICYEDKGEGPPLVFLHCWTGNKAFFFEQVKRFSSDYRCIAIDFPGHGGSDECDEYSVESFAEITVGLMKKLKVKKAVFAGHSMGGMVGMQLALDFPELVKGIILLDTTSYLSGHIFQRAFASVAVLVSPLGTRPVKAVVAGIAATYPLAGMKARVITGRECCKVPNRVTGKSLNSFRKFNVTDRLGEIDTPALIVVGTADMLADVRHAKTMARGLPNSTMKVVHGAGHMALFEKPEVVNEAMEGYLNRVYPSK
ncbi:MAG: alpha/beta hydrolase [Actinobacteria bacterium]|nr:alpha/beta hydrolase [Actinomycetota bacterium]MCG2796285.1 alpha/beta hydrolase [Actinomycetes bacterium]